MPPSRRRRCNSAAMVGDAVREAAPRGEPAPYLRGNQLEPLKLARLFLLDDGVNFWIGSSQRGIEDGRLLCPRQRAPGVVVCGYHCWAAGLLAVREGEEEASRAKEAAGGANRAALQGGAEASSTAHSAFIAAAAAKSHGGSPNGPPGPCRRHRSLRSAEEVCRPHCRHHVALPLFAPAICAAPLAASKEEVPGGAKVSPSS